MNQNTFTIIETILRDRQTFFEEIRDSIGIREKITAMLNTSFVFLAIYGFSMGISHSFFQALSSALKLPVLFLVTLLICVPSLHYFNVFFGSRQSISQTLALILTAFSTTAVLLLSFAPIGLFFMLTAYDYQFIKLLNVAFFAVASVLGIAFLRQGLRVLDEVNVPVDSNPGEGSEAEEGEQKPVSRPAPQRGTRRLISFLWMVLYGFVGTQMAWTLRPFFNVRGEPFVLFRQVGGNFYSNVILSITEILG